MNILFMSVQKISIHTHLGYVRRKCLSVHLEVFLVIQFQHIFLNSRAK